MERSRDRALVEEVEHALREADLLGPYAIRVEVRDGRVVLTGVVDVLAEVWKAEEVVRRLPGVREVENGLTISTDGQITDEDVQREVEEELERDPRVDLRKVGAQVKEGVVTLVGRAGSLAQIRAAREAAARARGVRRVQGQLQLEDAEVDDATLTNRVETALSRHPAFSALLIRTEARRGTVTLKGRVPDALTRELATEIAAEVEGVREVDNRIAVGPY